MGVIFRYQLKVIRYQLLYMVQQRESIPVLGCSYTKVVTNNLNFGLFA